MRGYSNNIGRVGLCACLAWLTACTSPGYNNNPSQQISDDKIGCPAATDFFAVYFNVHVQPLSDNQESKVTRQQFHAYCKNIPIPGHLYFTADLVGNELRKTPIGIQIVEQELTGLDSSRAENFIDVRTVSEIAPQVYAKGVIEAYFEASKPGYYAVYLVRKAGAATAQDELKILLSVGMDEESWLGAATTLGLLGSVLGAALISRGILRHRRKRKTIL
jgi:hypothetical protein